MILFSRRQTLPVLLGAILFLDLFDLWATSRLIGQYGPDVELNPLMHHFFACSTLSAAVFKLLTLFLFLVMVPLGARVNFPLAYRGCQVVLICLILVTFLHLINFFRY